MAYHRVLIRILFCRLSRETNHFAPHLSFVAKCGRELDLNQDQQWASGPSAVRRGTTPGFCCLSAGVGPTPMASLSLSSASLAESGRDAEEDHPLLQLSAALDSRPGAALPRCPGGAVCVGPGASKYVPCLSESYIQHV